MSLELQPSSLEELRAQLESARVNSEHVVGAVDLKRMNRLIVHAAEDMTVTVEAGITLGELQTRLREKGQWLPIDPPTPNVTIKEVLDQDLSGPRRFGYSTIREHLIGITVLLANGKLIHSGGQVVKNVAGYDLQKLFIGARGTLGIITECTFKLRPLPETEAFVKKTLPSLEAMEENLTAVLESNLEPVVLDAVRLNAGGSSKMIVGFAGTQTDVNCQLEVARQMGISYDANLQYETDFWSDNDYESIGKLSVPPSRLRETLSEIKPRSFVARAGNGIIYYSGQRARQAQAGPDFLTERIKAAFDPDRLFSCLADLSERKQGRNV